MKATKAESEEKTLNRDILVIKILNLDLSDEDPREYNIKATFMDQLVIFDTIVSNLKRTKSESLTGQIDYDPSDYQRMNKFADTPLIVSIQPATLHEYQQTEEKKNEDVYGESNVFEVGCYICNIDIVKIFADADYLKVEKRMDSATLSVLRAKSWQNLPLLSIEITAERNEKNTQHHKVLRDTNLLKFTLIGCYDIKISSDNTFSYECITELPLCNVESTNVALFKKGEPAPRRFNHASFYPKWESRRVDKESYSKCDEKFSCDKLDEFYNPEHFYLDNIDNKTLIPSDVVLWTSFHRSLIVKSAEKWLYDCFHRHKWPLEVHLCGEADRYCFVGFLDLVKLIYPGEHTVRLAVPLRQVHAEISPEECGGGYLVSRNLSTRIGSTETIMMETLEPTNTDTNYSSIGSMTYRDESINPFVLVEMKLARPLKKSAIPPSVTNDELMAMLWREEQSRRPRECAGRSHTDRQWRETVSSAAQLLHTLPRRDVCTFHHDLITSKTRVEIETSFWQETAHYVNINFIASLFLESDEAFEELRTMAHIYMLRAATETVFGIPDFQERRLLQAARQARQMQDIPHAIDLYLQLLAVHNRDPDLWRELATCFLDVDKKLANVCINKALILNPRHPLSLLSKACLVMDEKIEEAEVFFLAILALYPFCTLMWIVTSAYYFLRGSHDISEKIMEHVKHIISVDISESPVFPRAWNCELGDWWDHTPVLVGRTPYYDAADLLLRLRGITLAEVCLALSLSEDGATPMYHHLLSLCCRLRGDVKTALCHLQHATRSGAYYLFSLEGECHHLMGNWTAAKMCLEKSVYCSQPFSVLLAISTSSLSNHDISVTQSVLMDLVRRQPSAYAWTKLAQFFIMKTNKRRMDVPGSSGDQDSASHYIVACAEQALKYDRYFEYAWTILSRTVQPTARRVHCQNMATWCGHMDNGLFEMNSRLPHGDLIGKTVEACQCQEQED